MKKNNSVSIVERTVERFGDDEKRLARELKMNTILDIANNADKALYYAKSSGKMPSIGRFAIPTQTETMYPISE